jgi:hypothetical protein
MKLNTVTRFNPVIVPFLDCNMIYIPIWPVETRQHAEGRAGILKDFEGIIFFQEVPYQPVKQKARPDHKRVSQARTKHSIGTNRRTINKITS